MVTRKRQTQQFRAREEDFEGAYAFVEETLSRKDISKESAMETLLVFEALFQKLIDSEESAGCELEISSRNRLGDIIIRIGFEGPVFTPFADGIDSVEDKILDAHDDKLDYSYRAGDNVISITVARSYQKAFIANVVAAAAALVVYFVLDMFLDASAKHTLLEDYVFPIERLYTNAVLMVGTPLTFFSLLKNLTDTYVVSQKQSNARRLQIRTFITSVIAIAMAFLVGFALSIVFSDMAGTDAEYAGGVPTDSVANIISGLIPDTIFEPFEMLSPVPLIVVSLLVTYALCSTGKHFDFLRQAIDACFSLFSRMLRFVIAVLPVFCFVAFLDVFLDVGAEGLLPIFVDVVLGNLSIAVLLAIYAVRLRIRGIRVVPFTKRLVPLLRENIKIGSSIDAVSYNVRYCARNFKMNRKALEEKLPVLAQINLDGNCYLIMLVSLMFIFITGTPVSWVTLGTIALLVLFLSLGAPNQPGSMLIGVLIVITYLNSTEMLSLAICAEAFLANAQNIVNVVGDIVMVAEEELGNEQGADEAES